MCVFQPLLVILRILWDSPNEEQSSLQSDILNCVPMYGWLGLPLVNHDKRGQLRRHWWNPFEEI